MEDVLHLYAEAYDPTRPVVCFDELPSQLVEDSRPPLPRAPGVPVRDDYEYVRWGTCNLFGCFEPLIGRRQIVVTERRTKEDFAAMMRRLVDEWYPEADVIRVVLDNLNTHTGAALYEAYEPAEARRILDRLEWRFGVPEARTTLARQLAQSDGDRMVDLDAAVFGSADRRDRDGTTGDRGMGSAAQCGQGDGGLAIRGGGGAHDTAAPLSCHKPCGGGLVGHLYWS